MATNDSTASGLVIPGGAAPALKRLRLGTRGSMLARTQSLWVADEIEKGNTQLQVEITIIETTGDVENDQPLHDLGGKGLFTKEIEQALLRGEIDAAVHSFKDVPVTQPLVDTADLVIAAAPLREDPRDVLVCGPKWSAADVCSIKRLRDLPKGAVVGTGSLRRTSQLLHLRADLRVEPLRGNIDTRLRKVADGRFDAILLALAGVKRSSLFDATLMTILEFDEMLPAPGQGALAIQCRRTDSAVRAALACLHDPATMTCVTLERALVQKLGGDCHSPIAALAVLSDDSLSLRAAVGARDGSPPVVFASANGKASQGDALVDAVHATLVAQGAQERLAS